MRGGENSSPVRTACQRVPGNRNPQAGYPYASGSGATRLGHHGPRRTSEAQIEIRRRAILRVDTYRSPVRRPARETRPDCGIFAFDPLCPPQSCRMSGKSVPSTKNAPRP